MDYFSFSEPKNSILLNIPHSSAHIPQEFLGDFLLPNDALENESFLMADLFAKELYPHTKYGYIASEISRIVCDIERFENDESEFMSEFGLGVLYTKSHKGEIIRLISPKRREELLDLIYRPYHKKFNDMTKKTVERFGKCIVVDCHTYPSQSRYYENSKTIRPDICLGTDEKFTPSVIVQTLKNFFEKQHKSVSINKPYSGTIVPSDFFFGIEKADKISSIMIEINKNTYMNEGSFTKRGKFDQIKEIISEAIDLLASL